MSVPVVGIVRRETMSETSVDTERSEFEGVLFDSGWFVVREVDSRGENGQWIASRETLEVAR
jgi:hypothetical protein